MFEVTGIYLVTDRAMCGKRPVFEVVAEAVRGGVRMVQVREKELSTRAFIDEARRIKEVLAPLRVPLIINDRVDVALAVGADGVHLGQNDMPPKEARKIMGEEAIIGLSVETWEDVLKAEAEEVNYLGVSPIFPTPTKTDTKGVWGIEGLRRIREFSRHPLVAIGGLKVDNMIPVLEAGADAIAVVSAICAAPDPFFAARSLYEIYEKYGHKKIK